MRRSTVLSLPPQLVFPVVAKLLLACLILSSKVSPDLCRAWNYPRGHSQIIIDKSNFFSPRTNTLAYFSAASVMAKILCLDLVSML
jgi:hypothetical protein